MYLSLGISLTLAFLLIVNMAAAILSIATGRLIARPMTFLSVNTQARVIFALRFGPVVAALIFVFAFVVPAYLLHEPEDSGEVVSGKLALIAAASSIAPVGLLARMDTPAGLASATLKDPAAAACCH